MQYLWSFRNCYLNYKSGKISTLESDHNSLEQYGWQRNIETAGIPHSLSDQNLEEKVVNSLNEISFDVSPKDIKSCHRLDV